MPRVAIILMDYQGEKLSGREISEKTGIRYQTIMKRHHQGKQGADLVSNVERHRPPKLYKYNGKLLTMAEIAAIAGKSICAVRLSYYYYKSFKYINSPNRNTAKARVLCTIKGVQYKASDLSRLLGISRQAIHIHYHSRTKKEFTDWAAKRLDNIKKSPRPKTAHK